MALLYCQGTVRPAGGQFDKEDAANRLHKAIKGLGTDEKEIIDVLAGHCNDERQVIKTMYKTMFGQDLVDDLKGDLSGNFETLCLYLLMPSPLFDAFCINKAIQGVGTDEARLVEILCTKTNTEIEQIKEEYRKFFGRELEKDIRGDTSGAFQHILVSLVQGNRDENQTLDGQKAKEDAKALFEAGENRIGTDTAVFNWLLAQRNVHYLQLVFKEYRKLDQQDIEGAIKSETSGNVCKAFLAIVRYIKDPMTYYADCFNKCIKGLGTNDDRLMELVVSHAEVDMVEIGEAYLKKHKVTLPQDIADDTSGDYRKLLVRLTTPQT